ncbi:putative Actin [Trypanosoma vivax]|nr:putative Actin [Trypanosoma vivax]
MRIPEGTSKVLANVSLPDEVAVVHRQAAVVDIGACTTRVGFSGDDSPRINEPTCVILGDSQDGRQCLRRAYEMRASGGVVRVIEGSEVNWEAMEELLTHLSEVLQLNNKELFTPLLLTEKMFVPRVQRQRLTEILMEKLGTQALYFASSPTLALYASGTCSGVSVEMGYNACHVVPVFQGCPIFHAAHALNYCGNFFTRYMMESGPALPDVVHPQHRLDVWQHLKEKHCEACPSSTVFHRMRVTEAGGNGKLDEEQDAQGDASRGSLGYASPSPVVHHQLPDGTIITLGSNRFVPAEMLFDPSLVQGNELSKSQALIEHFEHLRTFSSPQGLHQLFVESVRKCDMDLHSMMYNSIHLSGGGSLLRGLLDRLQDEVASISGHQVRMRAFTERRNAAFVGGSILASLPTFQDFWVTRAVYEEFGPSAVMRRCL